MAGEVGQLTMRQWSASCVYARISRTRAASFTCHKPVTTRTRTSTLLSDHFGAWLRSLRQLQDLRGGAVIIRGGEWTDLNFNPCPYNEGNPCFNLSGSEGHPVYVMAYPGERVQTNRAISSVTYQPFPHVCCVTIDGLIFRADRYGLGDAFSGADTNVVDIHQLRVCGMASDNIQRPYARCAREEQRLPRHDVPCHLFRLFS